MKNEVIDKKCSRKVSLLPANAFGWWHHSHVVGKEQFLHSFWQSLFLGSFWLFLLHQPFSLSQLRRSNISLATRSREKRTEYAVSTSRFSQRCLQNYPSQFPACLCASKWVQRFLLNSKRFFYSLLFQIVQFPNYAGLFVSLWRQKTKKNCAGFRIGEIRNTQGRLSASPEHK